MILYIIISLVAIFLSYIAGSKSDNKLLGFAFVLITVFLSLGYNWGNDVQVYNRWFDIYCESGGNLFDFSSYFFLNNKEEYGWIFLNKLFKPLGFWGMRAVLFCFENYIIYRFISRNVFRRWYWLAMFVYVVDPTFMLMSSTMMRQWLAMCLVVQGFEFIERKKTLLFVIMVLLASTIHQTSIVCMALVILPYINYTQSKEKVLFVILFFVVYYILSSIVVEYVVLYLNTEDIYNNYTAAEYSSGIGIAAIIRFLFIIGMFAFVSSVETGKRIYIVVLLLYGMVLPLYNYTGLASRLGYYFTIFSIVSYPIFLQDAPLSKDTKNIFTLSTIAFLVYSNFLFFTNPLWYRHFGNYETLFHAGIL